MKNILIMVVIAIGLSISGCSHHHSHHKKGKLKGLIIEEEVLRFQNRPPKVDLIMPPAEPPKEEVAPTPPAPPIQRPSEEASWWPWN